MLNAVIFKHSVKKNFKLWFILTGVLSFFACMVALLAKVSPDFELPGSSSGTDLITIYAGAFYSMMGLMLILVYVIATGNRLVVSEVDKGDLSYTLNTPINRKELIVTKAIFYISSIFLMILLLSIIGTSANAIISPGELDYRIFWEINFVMFCFMFAISGISFASSCWFNKSGNALTIGAGLPIAFFLFNTIAGFGSELKFFKYMTLNTLFNPMDIIAGNSYLIEVLILAGLGFVFYTIGIIRFLKKDLPL